MPSTEDALTTDRSIHLDLGMPTSTGSGNPGGHGMPSDPRSSSQLSDEAQSLRELLDAQRNLPPAEAAAPAVRPSSPFDLFGGRPPATGETHSAASTPASPASELHDTLHQLAQRLLVGDGSSGRRSVQIQLAIDSLPGVVVEIFEESGTLVAQFTCAQEVARERLVRSADWLAEGLARGLARPCCVRIQTDDPEDRCQTEARANG